MKKQLLLAVCTSVGLTACGFGPESPRGFSLPEGDAQAGKALFAEYRCTDCHTVEGITVPADHNYVMPKPVSLGGSSSRVTTYGELVTSVINPSHKLSRRYPVSQTTEGGKSRMRDMNDIMTVADLIDIVAFLQPKYEVVPYRTTEYRLYELRNTQREAKD
ncbi:cytochrome c [Alteromonas sp. ASW11-19]|uniref:Cytochrome c n=1 Tax=Alteromonas salexigens TaxID=2982530 RepID=A0ABT2VM23_9ALTE|nr:cytochrome c [Alteromonas salexigens]MCU7554130.1 cytochrome c [Alteromonas salexigens]